MTVEREVKLPVSPAFRVPPLDGVFEGLRMSPRDDVTLHTVYYDAPDLRLIRAGASLRYREEQGWTVKLPDASGTAAMARHEVEFATDGGVVPDRALDLLRAYLRTSDVVPVLRLRTVRRAADLRDAEGRVVAEIVDDEVEAVHGAPTRARFREVEVERRVADADGVVDAVVERLRAAGAGEPEPLPKPARALGAIATAPPDVVEPKLPDDPTAAEVIRHAIASSVLRLVRHDPVIRLDVDPEGVHQARVATRRLRSDLRTFARLLDGAWTRDLREELAWLGDVLGAARDADVLLDRLRDRVRSLSPAEQPAAARVVGTLEQREKDAQAAVMDALASRRYAVLLDALVGAANAPAVTGAASRPAHDMLPSLVLRPWKKLEAAVREAGEEPTNENLHRVRIRAKRLRYAAEAVTPVAGKRARRLAAAAEDVQDVLGEHQDAVVAAGWLRAWSADRSADEAFTAGALAGREDAAAKAARAAWPEAWRALERRGRRGLR